MPPQNSIIPHQRQTILLIWGIPYHTTNDLPPDTISHYYWPIILLLLGLGSSAEDGSTRRDEDGSTSSAEDGSTGLDEDCSTERVVNRSFVSSTSSAEDGWTGRVLNRSTRRDEDGSIRYLVPRGR